MRFFGRLFFGWRPALALLLLLAGLGALLLGIRLGSPIVWTFEGRSMADSYHVTIVNPPPAITKETCANAVATALDRVDALLSTYRDDSEVVRFSRSTSLDWQPVSRQTADAVALALEIAQKTGGGYDITVATLVDLWGFGPQQRPPVRPELADIRKTLETVGPTMIEVRPDPPSLRKKKPRVRIDLSSVGQGIAVDRAAEALEQLGITRYCVEFSGEVRVRGPNPRNQPWQIGIDKPVTDHRETQQVIALAEGSMATSGDYRNYIEVDGVRYCHILDTRTGYPITHSLASVTVWDKSCARADAWATALLVAGPEAAQEIATRQNLRAMFIIRQGDQFVIQWAGKPR